MLLNISSSPFTIGKAALRRDMVRQEAVKNRRPLVYVNQVGGNDELVFDGHSLAFDASGALVGRGRDFEEDFLVYESIRAAARLARPRARCRRGQHCPARRKPSRRSRWACATTCASAAFRVWCSASRAASTRRVTAAPRGRRARPSQVTGVAMPTRYSSAHSRGRRGGARASNLGIGYEVVPIDARVPDATSTRSRRCSPGVAAGRRRREHPGARARRDADGVLEQVRRAAAHDRQQVRDRRRLLHALRRHGRRPRRDQRRAEDVRLPPGATTSTRAAGASHPASQPTKAPSAELRPEPDGPGQPAAVRRARSHHRGLRRAATSMSTAIAAPASTATSLSRRVADRPERIQAPPGRPGLKITSKAFGVGRRYPIAADYSEHDTCARRDGAGQRRCAPARPSL